MTIEYPLSHYISESQNLNNKSLGKTIKVAILSSFTINGLSETLQVKCANRNINCIPYIGGYNQYNQEILDVNSNLYKFSPNLTFLILDLRSIMGELFYFPYSISVNERKNFIHEKLNEIINIVDVFTKNSKSKLIVTNLSYSSYSPFGISEQKTDFNFQDMVMLFNNNLKEKLKQNNSVYILDFLNFVFKYGEKNLFNYQNFLFGDIKISLDHIPFFANEFLSYIIPFLGLTKKCIVLDLDNTLWGGIVGEDGFEGIQLGLQPPGNAYIEFQKHLKSLTKKGILLAINSKNNENDALKIIKEHPHMVLRENDFSAMRINWTDKATNMKEIAEELNLGLDSFVFFDDDPVNREYVRKAFPAIMTPEIPNDPSEYSVVLQSIIDFNTLEITDEDFKRGDMYLQQKERKNLEKQHTSLTDFLKSLNLHIIIKKSNDFTIPRISQLTLKTNQFNLTTKRYQEEDIHKFLDKGNMLIGCVQVKDKFGDNGITGVFMIDKQNPNEWIIDNFLLSCRIMGREVEKAILYYIIEEAKKNNVSKIRAKYLQTDRNAPIKDFLSSCGFIKENSFWIYNVSQSFKYPEYLKLEIE